MDFFDKLGETIIAAGKDVSQKAKDVSGVAKLRLDIRSKEDYIRNQYQELGKDYYNANKDRIDVPERYRFDQIDEALDDIAEMELRILELKKARRCPKCGAEVSDSAEFCSSCGEQLGIFEED